MIHYHGLPITSETVCVSAISGGHAFLSHAYPQQVAIVVECCQSFAVDNGAFSALKSGKPVTDWGKYYDFIERTRQYPSFDFCVIPDDIDGGEQENDDLVAQWPWRNSAPWVGAPVWHMHESINRLFRLCCEFPRVCIGSSGQFAQIGTSAWWSRIADAMDIATKMGRPLCKLHGLRQLDPEIFSRLPYSSADSTNIAKNVGIDCKWTGSYKPPTKEARAAVMRARIESHNSPVAWSRGKLPIKNFPLQQNLFPEIGWAE